MDRSVDSFVKTNPAPQHKRLSSVPQMLNQRKHIVGATYCVRLGAASMAPGYFLPEVGEAWFGLCPSLPGGLGKRLLWCRILPEGRNGFISSSPPPSRTPSI